MSSSSTWYRVCLALACLTCHGQFRFDSWTAESDLRQNSIFGLRQTRDGYLWMTTPGGLVRFDGMRFREFNRQNTPELESVAFTFFALIEDRQGCLWAGTWTGGAVRYCQGRFQTITTRDGLPSNEVVRIDEDEDGSVWIFTSPGLSKWTNGKLTRIDLKDYALPSKDLVGADAYLYGLWKVNSAGWERFAYGRWSHFPLPPGSDPMKLRVRTMVEDSQRRLWYRFADSPTRSYCLQDGKLTMFDGLPPKRFVNYQDRRGHLWSTEHSGEAALLKDGKVTVLPGFTTTQIFRALEDREGTIWLGTTNGGLFRATPRAITAYRHPGGAELSEIGPVLEDRSGRLWFGSRGLIHFRNPGFQNVYRANTPVNLTSKHPQGWDNIVTAIHEDPDGTLLAGTWDGVALFSGEHLVEYPLLTPIRGRVNVIHRDSAGDLWVGGEQGLYCLHAGALRRIGGKEGLPGDEIRAHVMRNTADGDLWIGTSKGLLHWRKGAFGTLSEGERLARVNVTAIHEDADRVLWVGAYDTGLYRLRNGKVTSYSTASGLYANAVFHILEDDAGYFWINSPLGIYRVGRRDLNDYAEGRTPMVVSTHFGRADGAPSLAGSPFGQPAGYKSRDGKLWFPTAGGLAVVDPRVLTFNPVPPPVVIEDAMVEGKPALSRSGVELKPGEDNLEVQFTALSLIKPEQIRFRYRLEGLDPDWTNAGTRRAAYYSRIPPGHYTLRVTAANADGVWNETGASLAVHVHPPYCATWWFRSLSIVGAAGAVCMFWLSRARRYERRQALQHAFSRN